jgi:hypothetical protein
MRQVETVAILGAGPVGLAAAAHALERGLEPIVLEAGPRAGHAVRQWGHVRMFSPWKYNVDKAAERLLAAQGWNAPDPEAYPTGDELAGLYLEPLAERTAIAGHLRTSHTVECISRVGFDKVKSKGRAEAPFEIRYSHDGRQGALRADAVIDATGTWSKPGPAGANGLPAFGERENAGRIAYGMPDVLGRDRALYAGRTVAVLGAGHSAAGTLVDLVALAAEQPGTRVVWLVRGADPAKSFGGGANDKLVERGALGSRLSTLVEKGAITVEAGFRVGSVERAGSGLRIVAQPACAKRGVAADRLVVATGFRPDHSFLSELRLALDPALDCPPALAPLIDPNEHSCGTVRPHGARELAQPEPGLYLAGMKSYGRAPTFLMLTGYEQVRSIVADLAGDKAAAERVELELPETGVCSAAPRDGASASADSCCGGPPVADASACCKADETAKAEGKDGCGSAASKAAAAKSVGEAAARCCG